MIVIACRNRDRGTDATDRPLKVTVPLLSFSSSILLRTQRKMASNNVL